MGQRMRFWYLFYQFVREQIFLKKYHKKNRNMNTVHCSYNKPCYNMGLDRTSSHVVAPNFFYMTMKFYKEMIRK